MMKRKKRKISDTGISSQNFLEGGDMKTAVPLVNDIIKEIERRILNNFMDLLVLSMLHHYPDQISGYDVIKHVQMRYRLLLSPGTVYACLYGMERDGLLRGKRNGRKRVYTLTRRGAETVRVILNARQRILKFMSMVLS